MLSQRRVRRVGHALQQRAVQMHQLARYTRLLRPRCHCPGDGQPPPGLDHIRGADPEPFRRLARRQGVSREHAISQVLRVGLTPAPGHRRLPHQPAGYESHVSASRQAKTGDSTLSGTALEQIAIRRARLIA